MKLRDGAHDWHRICDRVRPTPKANLDTIEVSIDQLKQSVESQYGGTATFTQAVPVHEVHEGETVWDGVVHIFDLAGHPTAKRAYAWSYERPDGWRRFFAVLHSPPITSPRDAVRAAIVAEAKAK